MYSLPTLNNKKITAMFYVHLFLKAMYRKENQIFFVFPNICIHLGNTEAESRLHHKGDVQKQRRSQPNAATGSRSTEAELTGNILVNITRTTSGSKWQLTASLWRPCAHIDPADVTRFTGGRKVREIRSYMYFAVKSPNYELAVLNSHAFPTSVP